MDIRNKKGDVIKNVTLEYFERLKGVQKSTKRQELIFFIDKPAKEDVKSTDQARDSRDKKADRPKGQEGGTE